MANRPFNFGAVSEELKRRVKLAWSTTEEFERPPERTDVALPYAVVTALSAEESGTGAQCVAYDQSFVIAGRFAWPTDLKENAFKEKVANDLFERIFPGTERHFMSLGGDDLGTLQKIPSVNLLEIGEPMNRTLEIQVSFTLRTNEKHLFS